MYQNIINVVMSFINLFKGIYEGIQEALAQLGNKNKTQANIDEQFATY
jgi:hypothetical protein